MLNKPMQLRSQQSGNAMVEFALVATVLTPILIFTPTLTKTADANMATAQAARYGAWEQTVRPKSRDTLTTEINNRFYAKPDMAIRTNLGSLAAEDQQNAFWNAVGFEDGLVNREGESLPVTVGVRERELGGAAGVVGEAVDLLGDTLGKLTSDSEWDLDAGGLYTINVILKLNNRQKIPTDERSPDCGAGSLNAASCMGQQSAILIDTWSASGPSQVEDRVRSLVPAGMLEPVGAIVAIAGDILPMFQELKNLDDAFGEVRPDILPPDRFGTE